MPSPFPGMDPYLEAPHIWRDFHDRLAGQISTVLNALLPAPYYAQLEMRPEVGVVEDEGARRRIVPDVAVVRPPAASTGGAVAVLDAPRRSKSPTFAVQSEPTRHAFVEVRDSEQGHRLITLIEIVSPSNKRQGKDRQAYLRKQQEVLDSDASLVELDLLRTGERLLSDALLEDAVARRRPAPDYLVLVNRAWERSGQVSAIEVYPVLLTEPLPCVGIPLREGQEETLLDLQYAFQHAYDGGPYRRGAVDYGRPPQPPLAGEWATWADDRVRAWRAGG